MTWQLQEAKNKLSSVVDIALSQGPQIISRRGKNTVVVVSYADYRRMLQPAHRLKTALKKADFSGLDLARDRAVVGRQTDEGVVQ